MDRADARSRTNKWQVVPRLVASSLAARGFGKGDVLAIWMPNVPEYAVPFLAVSMLGGINTTLNSLYLPDEAAFQAQRYGRDVPRYHSPIYGPRSQR